MYTNNGLRQGQVIRTYMSRQMTQEGRYVIHPSTKFLTFYGNFTSNPKGLPTAVNDKGLKSYYIVMKDLDHRTISEIPSEKLTANNTLCNSKLIQQETFLHKKILDAPKIVIAEEIETVIHPINKLTYAKNRLIIKDGDDIRQRVFSYKNLEIIAAQYRMTPEEYFERLKYLSPGY